MEGLEKVAWAFFYVYAGSIVLGLSATLTGIVGVLVGAARDRRKIENQRVELRTTFDALATPVIPFTRR